LADHEHRLEDREHRYYEIAESFAAAISTARSKEIFGFEGISASEA